MAYTYNPINSVRKWFTGVLPLVYDDALSYYEQISKFTDKLNEVINTTNQMSESLASIVGGGKDYYINVTNPGGTFKALIGDGNTDNTEAFKALANLENAVLFFPAGIYATKSVTCKCDIVGAGALDSQILCLNDNTANAGIIMTNNSNIYSIGINGNKGGQSEEKACLSLTDGGMAYGVRCYNGVRAIDISGDNCQFMGQIERCTSSGNVTGNHNFICACEDEDSITNSGVGNVIITNFKFDLNPNSFAVTADNVTTTATGTNTVSGATVNTTATGTNTVSGATVNSTATGTNTVSGATVNSTATGTNTVSGATVNSTATGTNTVSGATVNSTATGTNTVSGANVTLNSTTPVTYRTPTEYNKFFKTVPITGKDGNTYNVLVASDKTDNLGAGIVSVKDYGAVGDGVTDDYQAFADAYNAVKAGDTIIVPCGDYYLSKNPYPVSDNVITTDSTKITKWATWLISYGTTFKGAGIGDVSTGNGTFDSPFLTNPWLTVSGTNSLINLNGVPNSPNGAIIGDSKELAPIDGTNKSTNEHRWYALEYRGSSTGGEHYRNCNVECLNQVLNITGSSGIAQEIDVNVYRTLDSDEWVTGLFIVGGGTVNTNCTAIDINRDDYTICPWDNGISIRSSTNAIYVDPSNCETGFKFGTIDRSNRAGVLVQQSTTGADCIVMKRQSDKDFSGSFLVCFDSDEDTELFAIDLDGNIRSKNGVTQSTVYTKSGTYANEEITIPIAVPVGKHLAMVGEVASVGFVAPCWVTFSSDTEVKVFVNGSGTGHVRIKVLYS